MANRPQGEGLEGLTITLQWRDGRYGGHFGGVGRYRGIASVTWTTKRDDPQPWHANIDAFGQKQEMAFTDADAGKEWCERHVNVAFNDLLASLHHPEAGGNHD